MREECTREEFLNDVKDHQLNILLNNGVYRHLVIKKPGSSNHWFEIVTYPWKLVVSGDMGTWVFSRIEDMFCFFRSDDGKINRSYWAEKLQNGTHGCSDAAKVYDGDVYKQRIIDHLEDYDLSDEHKELVLEELDTIDFDDGHGVYREIYDFSVDLSGSNHRSYKRDDLFTFQDVWEIDMKTYSYHYLWCCHAIVYAIQKYDEAMKAKDTWNANH